MQSLVLSKKEKDGFSEIRGLGEVPRNDEPQFLLFQLNAWKNKYTNKKKHGRHGSGNIFASHTALIVITHEDIFPFRK